MVMPVPWDWQKLHEITRNLLEKYVLDNMYSPFIKISYILTFCSASSGKFLRAIWGAIVSRAEVLILPRKELNSQLSHCALFKADRVFRCFPFPYFIQWATQIFLSCSGFFLHDWLSISHWSFCEYWNNSLPLQ